MSSSLGLAYDNSTSTYVLVVLLKLTSLLTMPRSHSILALNAILHHLPDLGDKNPTVRNIRLYNLRFYHKFHGLSLLNHDILLSVKVRTVVLLDRRLLGK